MSPRPPRPSRLVLLGHPVAHARSPRMQGAALAAAGIAVRYEALDVAPAALPATLAALRSEGAGGNVTIPHKEAVRVACDRVAPVAARAGAVNTFWVEDDMLVGDNTDVVGFERAVAALLGANAAPVRRVALLGAGGASRAVLAAVERWPGSPRVRLHNRDAGRAHRLANEFPVVEQVAGSPAEAVRDADLVVNATSVGLADDALPVAPRLLPAGAAALDLVYRAGVTPWVNALRARGLRADDGREMLVEQGVAAFERWFGVTPDRAVMRATLA